MGGGGGGGGEPINKNQMLYQKKRWKFTSENAAVQIVSLLLCSIL